MSLSLGHQMLCGMLSISLFLNMSDSSVQIMIVHFSFLSVVSSYYRKLSVIHGNIGEK